MISIIFSFIKLLNSFLLLSNPPESTRTKDLLFISKLSFSKSLVLPGSLKIIDLRFLTNLLKRVDFPTFGLPTIDINGIILNKCL